MFVSLMLPAALCLITPATDSVAATASAPVSACRVKVDAGEMRGQVSPLLIGFNVVYMNEPDAYWADGAAGGQLRDLKTGLLRWPGGEVTSFYHWNDMIDRGETDTWDPEYQPRQIDQAKFMNLEEYMTHVRAIGCEPMIGVNIMSGHKFNRTEEGLAEARALIQHCVHRGYKVKYWFIDNENYLPEKKPELTPAEYAHYINQYADVLKSIDPDIEIIANWYWGWNDAWKEILSIAGRNIDIADFHLYWRSGGTTWEHWLKQTPMGPGRNAKENQGNLTKTISYEETIRGFKEGARSMGLDLKVAALEWNIGPKPKAPISQFQAALMEAEQFGQFINGGMDMACFWPMHWPSENSYRTLLDHDAPRPHPNHQMFKLYSDALGQQLLISQADCDEVRTTAVRSNDGKTVLVYLLRKSGPGPAMPATISVEGFTPSTIKAVSFTSEDLHADQGEVIELPIVSQSPVEVNLPPHSLTQIRLSQ